MILLLPLGLLALSSIVALIIIYIIKPPYQNKMVSSSYLWKESLKYKKKRVNVSRFSQMITLICQILILALLSLILAFPMFELSAADVSEERIIIIDGSANMLAYNGEDTRFERAVSQAKELSSTAINNLETVTIIVADEESSYLCVSSNSITDVNIYLDGLIVDTESSCSFGDGDVETAFGLAESSIADNEFADVYFLTATSYNNVGEFNVIDVSSEYDYNSTIREVKKEMVDNYYQFTVDVAVYGQDETLLLSMHAEGVNDDSSFIDYSTAIYCTDELTYTVTIKDLGIYAFDSVYFSIASFEGGQDSFAYDNEYYLYGGRKEEINILYCSTAPNIFFLTAINNLQSYYFDDVSIQLTQTEDHTSNLSGFDYYIFEHTMPSFIPVDGVSFLVNPNIIPANLDITLSSAVEGDFFLDSNLAHPLLTYITPTDIEVSSYNRLSNIGDYSSILSCNGDDVLISQNTDTTKVSIMSFSVNNSNISMGLSFPLLMLNMYDYYLPQTLSSFTYDVGEDVEITARGSNLKISYDSNVNSYENNSSHSFDNVGTYTISHTLLSGEQVDTNFYIKVPVSQSNFTAVIEEIPGLFDIEKPETSYQDLLLWLALGLVILIFAEKLLQLKEEF